MIHLTPSNVFPVGVKCVFFMQSDFLLDLGGVIFLRMTYAESSHPWRRFIRAKYKKLRTCW